MSLPCLRRTGLFGRWSLELLCGCDVADVGGVPGRDKWAGTLSPMIRTHSEGKKPTSKPRLPRHQMLSSGGGMSITEIMSPTCISSISRNKYISHSCRFCVIFAAFIHLHSLVVSSSNVNLIIQSIMAPMKLNVPCYYGNQLIVRELLTWTWWRYKTTSRALW